MDQGIIQTVKLKFRRRQLRHIISEMEKDQMWVRTFEKHQHPKSLMARS